MIGLAGSLNLLSLPVLCWLCLAAGCTLLIIYTDIRYFWIPDIVVLLLFLSNGTACVFQLVQPNWLFTFLCLGCLAIAAFLLPSGIGWGDIKLIGALSLGSSGIVLYGMLCFAFGTALIGALLYWRLYHRKVIPFAPFLLSGWWISFFFADDWQAWLGFFL